MKHTKEVIYTFVLIFSITFLLSTYSEAKAIENEEIALDFVEKPEKRTREQALEKIKELSVLPAYPWPSSI